MNFPLQFATPADKSNLRTDLNLLRALQALIEERSVTRAAERLYITQSGMSKALVRLRELFDDPLFMRSQDGLVLTPRALELKERLRHIFDQIEACLTPPDFDPASARGVIRIATPEQFAPVAVPRLLLALRNAAPGIVLESQHLTDGYLDLLAEGTLDFVLFLDQSYPEKFHARRIYSAAPMLWCRRAHPLTDKAQIEFTDIFSYPQITFRAQNVTRDEYRQLGEAIGKAGLERNTVFDTSHLLIAVDVLTKTDAVMLAPDYLVQMPLLKDAITSIPIDHIAAFDGLSIDMALLQHERTASSPLHRWVAAQLGA